MRLREKDDGEEEDNEAAGSHSGIVTYSTYVPWEENSLLSCEREKCNPRECDARFLHLPDSRDDDINKHGDHNDDKKQVAFKES